MKLNLSDISEADFIAAIDCLEACRQENAADFGFLYPYFTPGGYYGAQWWQLDSALTLCGYKWENRKFAETALLNFINVQKEDGRIPLWGKDILPTTVAGGNELKQTNDVSSLPKLFDSAFHIVQGSTNNALKESVYHMFKKYLDWWFSHRQDTKTGLITAVFEETFIPYLGQTGEYAPVDTNVEVYVGCHYTEYLARELGDFTVAEDLSARKAALKNSINKWLWVEEKGAYYPYSIKESKNVDCLMASTFFPLRLGIASADKQEKLILLLKNHKIFNWDSIPITSVSKQDPVFQLTRGKYEGNASWSGNVWTLINEMVVRGLMDSGHDALAAELAWKTVCAFSGNYAEFISPIDGSGHGVLKYGWTASQYISLLVEVIFGISFNAKTNELKIAPKLTDELKKSILTLQRAEISPGIFLDVSIENEKVTYAVSSDKVIVTIV